MLPGQKGQSVGHLDYLVPLLQTETNPNSPFQLAYSACGLAAMSNREKAVNTDLTELSYMQHSRASNAIRQALADPARCKSDATLASVLLLSFFEVCPSFNPLVLSPLLDGPEFWLGWGILSNLFILQKITATKEMGGLLAWRTHIVGAVQIVSARGREMFKSKYSTQLFSAVRLEIVSNFARVRSMKGSSD